MTAKAERLRISTIQTKRNFNIFSYIILVVVVFLILTENILSKWVQFETNAINEAKRESDERDESKTNYPKRKDDGKRIPEYDRSGIVLPKRSDDTIECDDWETIVRKNIRCCVNCGFSACFNCIEARTKLRVCKNLKEDLVLFDEINDKTIVLPKNSSADYGYCMSKGLADGTANGNDDARRKCNIKNADWILARKQTEGDTHYNFLCKCKYPHLLTNSGGLMSPCDKDVACNGHGHLDEDSVAGRVDPFISGVCICDEGWVGDRDNLVGPFCREATFEEYPSMFFGTRQSDNDIELNDERVNINFRSYMDELRKDGRKEVYLPNPCGPPCKLRKIDEIVFCQSQIVADAESGINSIGIGVRWDRDYFQGNGGLYPNACLSIKLSPKSYGKLRVRMQYMSHDWNREGERFAPDFGFHLDDNFLPNLWQQNSLIDFFQTEEYKEKLNSFVPLDQRKVLNDQGEDTVLDTALIWNYNDDKLSIQNEDIWRSLIGQKLTTFYFSEICMRGDIVKIHSNDLSFYKVLEKMETLPNVFVHYAYLENFVCILTNGPSKNRRASDMDIGLYECGKYQVIQAVGSFDKECFDCDCCGSQNISAEDADRMRRWIPAVCLNKRKEKGKRLPEIHTAPGNLNPWGMITVSVDKYFRESLTGVKSPFNVCYETRYLHVPENFNMKQFFESRSHGWGDGDGNMFEDYSHVKTTTEKMLDKVEYLSSLYSSSSTYSPFGLGLMLTEEEKIIDKIWNN